MRDRRREAVAAKSDVAIVVDRPRCLVVSVKCRALNALLVSAHRPCEGDSEVPRFWGPMSFPLNHLGDSSGSQGGAQEVQHMVNQV